MTKSKTKSPDWERIEKDVRAGVLSLREIARRNNISDTAIRKYMKKEKIKRDLTSAVRKEVRNKMVRKSVRKTNANDKEIIEKSSDEIVEILGLHRQDIKNLKEQEARLLEELGDNPTKLYIAQYQGGIIEKVVDLTVTEQAGALRDLATVQHKRIQLERQAYNIDDGDDGDDEKPKTIRIIYDEKEPNGTENEE